MVVEMTVALASNGASCTIEQYLLVEATEATISWQQHHLLK